MLSTSRASSDRPMDAADVGGSVPIASRSTLRDSGRQTGRTRWLTGFAGDFLRGSACTFGFIFVLLCVRYLWDFRAGRMFVGEAASDLPFFFISFSVVTAANALAAAAGAGIKRCVLRSAVSSVPWIAR